MPNKSVLITGSSRGIGLAIAEALLKAGHNVFLVARSEEPLRDLQQWQSGRDGPRVEFLAGDVADDEVC